VQVDDAGVTGDAQHATLHCPALRPCERAAAGRSAGGHAASAVAARCGWQGGPALDLRRSTTARARPAGRDLSRKRTSARDASRRRAVRLSSGTRGFSNEHAAPAPHRQIALEPSTMHPFSICALALAAAASAPIDADAHVSLPAGGATAGDSYAAAFRVGHACSGARSTTGLTVRIPEGFQVQKAEPRPGWKLETAPGSVTWRAESAQTALPTGERAEFVVNGKLPAKPGTLWFKVLQSCDVGSADWAEVPRHRDRQAGLPGGTPRRARAGRRRGRGARRLGALRGEGAERHGRVHDARRAVGRAPRRRHDAGGGHRRGARDEDGGRRDAMRAVLGGLDLPPRQAVELKPSGYHVMLMDLKKPLVVGETVPIELSFVDRAGRKAVAKVDAPVRAAAATGASDAGSSPAHRH
jgi:uncharacterized protein YcnI